MVLPRIKVLLTAVGCPGAVTMIRALKNNGERDIEIVGTDMRPEVGGRFFVDSFYEVPPGKSPGFIPHVLDIVQKEHIDVVFPQSSYEVPYFAKSKGEFERLGIPVMVSSSDSIAIASNKWNTYQAIADSGVPFPESVLCTSWERFLDAIYDLGYPEKSVCFKPPISKGSRGFRKIIPKFDRLHFLLNSRPDAMAMPLEDVRHILMEAEPFPELIVMEYAEGVEYAVDTYAEEGEVLCGFIRDRDDVRAGLAMYFKMVKNDKLWHYGKSVVEHLGINAFSSIQFIDGKLIEVNPRVSTFIHQEDFNMPYLGLKHTLGEASKEMLKTATARVRTSRRSIRYYDQVFYDAQDLAEEKVA
jgi:carbamoyl-phosphate synthase large subunit